MRTFGDTISIYGTYGTGHIYQGRYKNFPIQNGHHLLNVWKYVEGNALRARLVRRAEYWRWSSLSTDESIERPLLCESPIERPELCVEWVNNGFVSDELTLLRRSVKRGAPYGDTDWTQYVATTHGLEFTMRKPGRQKQVAETAKGDAQLFPEVCDSGKS